MSAKTAVTSFSLSVLLPFIIGFALYFSVHDFRYFNEPLQAGLEAVDAFATLILALFLFLQKSYEQENKKWSWIVSALACIGIVGILAPLSATFTHLRWSRTIAHLLGALFLISVWLPERYLKNLSRNGVYGLAWILSLLTLGVLAVFGNQISFFAVPTDAFPPALRETNLLTGFLMMAGASYLFMPRQSKKNLENIILGNYLLLLGTTRALLFFSERWNPVWWLLYGIRVIGVAVVLSYMFLIFRKSLAAAVSSNRLLEKKVDERTKDLARTVKALRHQIQRRMGIERQLKEAAKKAEEANKLKSAFLANMSHEIRTPLGVVLGFTNILKDEDLSPEEKKNYYETILRNGQQLSNLINDILDLSKVEAGQLKMEVLHLRLQDLVTEVISTLNIQATNKNLSLTFSIDRNAPEWVDSDPTRLKQVLNNVIGNAIKFTPQGFVHLHVFGDREKVHFIVKDTGIGLTQKQKDSLFQPFTQADPSTTRKFGGTGLGLALSKKFASGLGGDLTIQSSSPGKGSTFEITVAMHLNETKTGGTQISEAKDELQGLRVLIVDDSPEFLELASRMLAEHRASVQTSEDGLSAVEKALRQDFDLILMDLKMPGMDGITATKKLRESGFQKPIIAVTASETYEDHVQCLQAGCTAELTKPLRTQELVKVINQYSNAG